MELVVDTSALIELERIGAPLAKEATKNGRYVIPAIVWAEALVGIRRADTAARAAGRRASLERVVAAVPICPFTVETAEHYADIFAELSKAGQMIPPNDIAVAATARSLNYGVLVGPADEAHFRRVRNLLVVCLRGGAE